jgi:O-antigen ligase
VFGQFETNRETALNSQFLATLGETGIIGVSLFMLMILAVARRTLRVRQAETDEVQRAILAAVFVGQLVFLLGGVVEYAWETQPLSFTFWLGSALVTKLAQHQAQSAPEPVAGANPEG